MAAFDFPTSPNNGDTYTENGITWTWNGTSWRRSSAVGAQGSVGAQGATGAQGAAGNATTGAQGAQGHQGNVGNTGAQGGLSTYAVPTGGIIIWSGASNAIPSGWVLCNGSNGTPDLRNRFIVGAGNSYSVGNTGGSDSVSLTEAQMPSHFHYSFRSGNHGQLRNGTNMNANNYPGSGTGAGNLYESYNINSSGSVANVGKTSNTGSGSSHENRPPYYALCYIMKT